MTDNYRELNDFEHNIMMGGPIGTFFRDNTTNKRYYIEASENKNEILFVFNGIDGGVYKLMFMGYRFSAQAARSPHRGCRAARTQRPG